MSSNQSASTQREARWVSKREWSTVSGQLVHPSSATDRSASSVQLLYSPSNILVWWIALNPDGNGQLLTGPRGLSRLDRIVSNVKLYWTGSV